MLRPKPLACSGVKSDVQVGTSDVTSGGPGAQNDVRTAHRHGYDGRSSSRYNNRRG